MDFLNYIIDKALVLIPVLLIIGQIIKMIPNAKDWIIPWVLLVLGVVMSCLMMGWGVDGVIQGVLVAGAAVFGNQLYKQTKEQD